MIFYGIISMKVEVSNGELVDKYTILLIKSNKILDLIKQKNIQSELKEIAPLIESLNLSKTIIDELLETNNMLWEIEEVIRIKEKKQEFDVEFIELARNVYKTNTIRFNQKTKINILTESKIIEEKSH